MSEKEEEDCDEDDEFGVTDSSVNEKVQTKLSAVPDGEDVRGAIVEE